MIVEQVTLIDPGGKKGVALKIHRWPSRRRAIEASNVDGAGRRVHVKHGPPALASALKGKGYNHWLGCPSSTANRRDGRSANFRVRPIRLNRKITAILHDSRAVYCAMRK